jgi:hypothetical protein
MSHLLAVDMWAQVFMGAVGARKLKASGTSNPKARLHF